MYRGDGEYRIHVIERDPVWQYIVGPIRESFMGINIPGIKLFVELHIKEINTVYEVSQKLRIPYDVLRKEFIRSERKPLGSFILKTKVRVIKEHLLIHDDPCCSICSEYGLRDDTGAKMFKRLTGTTMQRYRKRGRKKAA